MRKIFSILTFVTLFLPMLRIMQMCEMCEIENLPAGAVTYISSKGEYTRYPEVLSWYDLTKKTISFYFEMLKGDNDIGFFSAPLSFLFPFVAIISVLLILLSFLKKYNKTFLILSIVNLTVIIFIFLSFFITTITDDDEYIKYGFYLLILNSIIIIISGILHKKNKSVNLVKNNQSAHFIYEKCVSLHKNHRYGN